MLVNKNLKMQRIEWIDFSKGLMIIFIVLAHAISEETSLVKFLSIFIIQFFFIMSGFLFNLDKWGDKYGEFVSKRIKRILLPFFLANILFFPIWFVFCYNLGFLTHLGLLDKATPFTAIVATFIGNGNGVRMLLAQLWFLPALFFAEIIFLKLFNRLNKFGTEIFVLAIVFCAYIGLNMKSIGTVILNFAEDLFSFDCSLQYVVFPLEIDIALTSMIFLLVGISIRKNEVINKMDLKFCVLMALIVMTTFSFNDFKVNMSARIYGNTMLLYAGGIAGSLLVMKLFMKLSMLMTKFGGVICDFMNACGRQSMFILVLHPITANIFYDILAYSTNFTPEEFFTDPIIICTTTLIGTLIPLFIAEKFGKLPVMKYFCS